MNAQQTRQQHIAKVEAELRRLTAAVAELKAGTKDIPAHDWNWEGDWRNLAQMVSDVACTAEQEANLCSQENYSRQARKLARTA